MSNGTFLLKFYDDVIATDHAIERYNEATNIAIDKIQLVENFKKAEKISFDELKLLGFSCNYAGRIKNGEKSFYYIDNKTIKNNEIVYVLSEGETGNVLIIVTVLYHNKESQYRKEVFGVNKITINCRLLVVNY